jgi:chemotaxis response regulator CheB
MLQTEGIRVLLVDDDPDIVQLLRMRLERPPFDVVGEAWNGVLAIQMAASTDPDVIVLDVDMPVLDGLSAIGPLRRAAPAAVIVVCSSGSVYSDTWERVHALADAFVPKLDAVASLDERLLAIVAGAVSGAERVP